VTRKSFIEYSAKAMRICSLRIRNQILAVVLLSLVIMWFTPLGSFDPKTIGFYYAVVTSILTEFIYGWILKNFTKGL
jgi:hypothetical protein